MAIQHSQHEHTRVSPVTTAVGLLPEQWRAVLVRIDRDLSINLSIEELAETAGMSPSCFSRLFKQLTSITPCNYVIQQRVEKAKQLVLDNKLNLVDIAVCVGFADQAHLTRHFKQLTGMTPAQFCKRNRAQRADQSSQADIRYDA